MFQHTIDRASLVSSAGVFLPLTNVRKQDAGATAVIFPVGEKSDPPSLAACD